MDLLQNGRVSIFTDIIIEIDHKLPKYHKDVVDDANLKMTEDNIAANFGRQTRVNPNNFVSDGMDVSLLSYDYEADSAHLNFKDMEGMKWYEKLFSFFHAERFYKRQKEISERAKKRYDEEKKAEEDKKMTALDFFANVKTALDENEVKDYEAIIRNYTKQLAKAQGMGQTAIVEQMKTSIDIFKYEAILQVKKVKFLTEEQMIKLGKNSRRGIKIDYIKNFGRIIPDDVYKKKVETDSWKIYDNYVVVHYDPNNKGHKDTEAEQRAKKDPILFGVISGSTNLYYVGDWVDEYCDLTLDKAIEIINQK